MFHPLFQVLQTFSSGSTTFGNKERIFYSGVCFSKHPKSVRSIICLTKLLKIEFLVMKIVRVNYFLCCHSKRPYAPCGTDSDPRGRCFQPIKTYAYPGCPGNTGSKNLAFRAGHRNKDHSGKVSGTQSKACFVLSLLSLMKESISSSPHVTREQAGKVFRYTA